MGFIQIKTILSGFLLTLAILSSVACGPSQFQVSAESSSQKPSEPSGISSTTTNTATVLPAKMTCELLADRNPVNIGEKVNFIFNTTFNIPKDAKIVFSGHSFDVDFVTTPEQSRAAIRAGLTYTNGVQAGIHKRKIQILAADNTPICSTNVLEVEFAGESNSQSSGSSSGLMGKNISGLYYGYNSGTVSPEYQYWVGYQIDFSNKTILVRVLKGSKVWMNLPTAGSRGISDGQIARIKTLLNNLKTSNCDQGTPAPLGGGTSVLNIYTTSMLAIDSIVTIGSCMNLSEVFNQYQTSAADSVELREYLNGL